MLRPLECEDQSYPCHFLACHAFHAHGLDRCEGHHARPTPSWFSRPIRLSIPSSARLHLRMHELRLQLVGCPYRLPSSHWRFVDRSGTDWGCSFARIGTGSTLVRCVFSPSVSHARPHRPSFVRAHLLLVPRLVSAHATVQQLFLSPKRSSSKSDPLSLSSVGTYSLTVVSSLPLSMSFHRTFRLLPFLRHGPQLAIFAWWSEDGGLPWLGSSDMAKAIDRRSCRAAWALPSPLDARAGPAASTSPSCHAIADVVAMRTCACACRTWRRRHAWHDADENATCADEEGRDAEGCEATAHGWKRERTTTKGWIAAIWMARAVQRCKRAIRRSDRQVSSP